MNKLPHTLSLLLVALLILLAACNLNKKQPTPETNECPLPENLSSVLPVSAPNPEEVFVDGQILLVGGPPDKNAPSDIDELVNQPEDLEDLNLEELSPKDDRLRNVLNLNGLPVEVRLFSTTEAVWVAVERINTQALKRKLRVLAEPDYITNLPIGGSGNDGGSGIVGDPSGPGGRIGDGRARFVSQWAFSGPASIQLFDDNTSHKRTPGSLTGVGTRVVVFDTTPLSQGGQNIDWAVLPFRLCVWQPGLRFGVSGAGAATPTPDNKVLKGEHGLFVSGLAQGVAPGSEYYLIEVLDSKARGDVYTLIRAIALYLNTQPELPEMKTVFNMSLGIQAERVGLGQGATPAIDALRNNLKNNYATFDDYSFLAELSNRFPAIALKAAVASAEQAGVVVVAAAGNDRGANPNAQEQAPASFSEVIGVASSNYDREASCFSNPGDLSAPGGGDLGNSGCHEETPIFYDSEDAECKQGVVSLVTQGVDTSGYAYWMGTSFSTPIVSGLAALVWEEDLNRPTEKVRDILKCGVTSVSSGSSPVLGLGIANVGEALSSCP